MFYCPCQTTVVVVWCADPLFQTGEEKGLVTHDCGSCVIM